MKRSRLDAPPALRARPTIADYEQDLALLDHPGRDAFGHLRDLVLIGIRVGTLSVDDVYGRVRPATVALTVLLDPGADPGAGEAAQDLVRRIRRDAGRGTEPWAEAVAAVDAWPGSLRSLLRSETQEEGGSQPSPSVPVLSGLSDHLWRGANILLALAPPGTLPRIAAGAAPMRATGRIVGEPRAVRYARVLTRLAGHAPVSRSIVDHAMDPESGARFRMALAANPLTPNDVLIRLLTFADREPGVAAAVSLHECAPPAVRLAGLRRCPDAEVRERAAQTLTRDVAVVRTVERIARSTDGEAELAHALVRDADPPLPPEARLFAYAHLARTAGLEAVWTLEMERAGSLEDMDPAVRASMAAGSAVPLIEAALANPYRGMFQDSVMAAAGLRREEMLDWPFPWQDPDRPRAGQTDRDAECH